MNLVTEATQELECFVCRDSSKELVGIFATIEDAAEEYIIDVNDIKNSIHTRGYEFGSGYWNKEKVIIGAKSPFKTPSYEIRNISDKRGQHKHTKASTAVVQLDPKYMTEIARYHSMYGAFQQTGARNIAKCCKGIAKTSGGYKWMYAEEYDELVNDAPHSHYEHKELDFGNSEDLM